MSAHQDHKDKAKEHCTPDEVFVIIKFEASLAQAYRNTINSQTGMMQRTYQGQERFFCPEMTCTSGRDNRKRGIGILEFSNIGRAHDWLISEKNVKQTDWLYGVDIVIAPARTPWHTKMQVLELVDWNIIHDPCCFQEDYLNALPDPDPHTKDPYNTCAAPDYAMQRVRGNWLPRYLVMHQWVSVDDSYQCSNVQGSRLHDLAEIANGCVYVAVGEAMCD